MKKTMPPRKPVPEDFGLTEPMYVEAKAILQHRYGTIFEESPWWWVTFGGWLLAIASFLGYAYAKWQPGPWCGIVLISLSIIVEVTAKRSISNKARARSIDPLQKKVRLYEEAITRYDQALADRQRTLQDHWQSLRGTDFEDELAHLYQKLGYTVRTTKATGDAGIDLILEKNGSTTIVQCKGHAKPIGVGAARDLYGALMHSGVKRAVLACPAGFTQGVIAFVQGKPIDLVSTPELVAMAERVQARASNRSPAGVVTDL